MTVMLLLRRFLVMLALIFWQGGFMFYGAVTLPVIRELFGSEGSFVTQRVTMGINLAGTIALLVTFFDLYLSPLPSKRWRWLVWLLMFLPQPVMVWMHHEMSAQMLSRGFRPNFDSFMSNWHRPYLVLSSLQWLVGMICVWQSLRAWREEDKSSLAA
jgi:hypothetical protein